MLAFHAESLPVGGECVTLGARDASRPAREAAYFPVAVGMREFVGGIQGLVNTLAI